MEAVNQSKPDDQCKPVDQSNNAKSATSEKCEFNKCRSYLLNRQFKVGQKFSYCFFYCIGLKVSSGSQVMSKVT